MSSHHNALENFASRGLKAQARVDEILKDGGGHRRAATQFSPALDVAGVAQAQPKADARESGNAPARSEQNSIADAVNILAAICASKDLAWLRRVAIDADRPLTVRSAAKRRLRILTSRKAKKKLSPRINTNFHE